MVCGGFRIPASTKKMARIAAGLRPRSIDINSGVDVFKYKKPTLTSP